MTATFFTNLALGTLTSLMGTIMSLSSWVTGSNIIQGHLYWDNTNVTNSEYVGVQQTVKHTAAGYDFITNGSQSGITLLSDGLTRYKTYSTTCTSTGGITTTNAYYDTCYAPAPFSTTGSLMGTSIECAGIKIAAFVASGAFVKMQKDVASGIVRYPVVIKNSTIASGSLVRTSSGAGISWNPGDKLSVHTTAVIPKTTGLDCKLFYIVADKYGS